MSAREIIARGIAKETGSSLAWTRADAALNALTAAGYRILGPDELDEVTLRRAAKVVEAEYSDDWRDLPKLVASIRALSNGGKE